MRVRLIAESSPTRQSACKSAKHRLAEALSTVTAMAAVSGRRPTISAACSIAGVSRNTVYRYYPDLAEAVRHIGGRGGRRALFSRRKVLETLRSEVSLLRVQLAQMAALADHYHAAAEEQRALAARRDRVLANIRNNEPKGRRASIAERTPARQNSTRPLIVVPAARS